MLASVLVWRFLRTGGPQILAIMERSPDEMEMSHEGMSGMGA